MSLKSLTLLHEKATSYSKYPLSIPVIRQLHEMTFPTEVTFFVGENGSGKSTLLEAIADKAGFNTAGGGVNHMYDVHRSEASLGDYIRLSWLPKHRRGFFLRAESFYNFASYLDQNPNLLISFGGKSLLSESHGESFMRLFKEKFNGKALYLLDEPEAALSPQRQLSLLRLIKDSTEVDGAQYIIATHSPILLGYPGATIYNFDAAPLEAIAYEDTEHYSVTKYFVNHRERILHELFKEEEEEAGQ
ncbi:AAA family ATPase [Aureibacillus halotolerans]|uniref:Putative ATPase n=1 Tax=Aureibacillus halotolerans TaxID=1508390 RepID=A0A4R6TXN8_9BACI|nr:AAA family ATPase [Aureibacillus halotolerans]TDQ36779.1 putative ATPase [Aureibacillus halotolerans]